MSMDPGGRLSIISERIEDKIAIKVNDTGKGMPPEVLKQVVRHGSNHSDTAPSGRHLCGCLFCVMEERKKDFPGPAYNEP